MREVVSKRKPGAWWKIEQDMADWAKKNGVLRRSDHMCKRRFAVLRPDEYAEHRRVSEASMVVAEGAIEGLTVFVCSFVGGW